jgi:hypothetical protein
MPVDFKRYHYLPSQVARGVLREPLQLLRLDSSKATPDQPRSWDEVCPSVLARIGEGTRAVPRKTPMRCRDWKTSVRCEARWRS